MPNGGRPATSKPSWGTGSPLIWVHGGGSRAKWSRWFPSGSCDIASPRARSIPRSPGDLSQKEPVRGYSWNTPDSTWNRPWERRPSTAWAAAGRVSSSGSNRPSTPREVDLNRLARNVALRSRLPRSGAARCAAAGRRQVTSPVLAKGPVVGVEIDDLLAVVQVVGGGRQTARVVAAGTAMQRVGHPRLPAGKLQPVQDGGQVAGLCGQAQDDLARHAQLAQLDVVAGKAL